MRLCSMAVLLLFLWSCSTVNPYYDASKKHHTPKGFTNNYGPAGGKPLSQLLKWQKEAYDKGAPAVPNTFVKGYEGFPVLKPDLVTLAKNCSKDQATVQGRCQKISITWIGHATALVQIGGLNILTDPHFSERASLVQFAGPKRRVPLPVQLKELPRIDLVLISHNHYDHLDINTVKALQAQQGGPPQFVVPLGVDLWFKDLGISTNVQRFDWWESKSLLGVELHFVPSQHWSSRSPFDQNATLWGGWIVKELGDVPSKGKTFYFAGDSGMTKDFADIGQRFGGFDYSLIPVGAYEPRWFMSDQHVNPDEAVQIHKDVKSKWSLGIHWGTFELTDEPLDQPIGDLPIALNKAKVPASEFVLFKHGQTQFFD